MIFDKLNIIRDLFTLIVELLSMINCCGRKTWITTEITVNFDKWHDELLTKLDENSVNHWKVQLWKELPNTNFALQLSNLFDYPKLCRENELLYLFFLQSVPLKFKPRLLIEIGLYLTPRQGEQWGHLLSPRFWQIS